MLDQSSFRIVHYVVPVLIVLMFGCSSTTNQDRSRKTSSVNEEPEAVRIALVDGTLKSIFKEVYAENRNELQLITELKFTSLPDDRPIEACSTDMDLFLPGRVLKGHEEEKCRSRNFKPVDFPLTTLKTSGDTVYLYANKKSLRRTELRNYLESIFKEMTRPREASRYQRADTGLLRRNQGLLVLYGK